MKHNYIINWFNSINIEQDDLNILFNKNNKLSSTNISYNDIKIFLQGQLANNQIISFDECATKIIDKLFMDNVDDNTLVITSSSEHPSVYNNLKKCKHVIRLFNVDKYNCSIDLVSNIKQYNKVFVYVIGLSSGDNFYCSNLWFEKLKQILLDSKVKFTMVIDAVQELFLLPRDYSMFDYVIGTAHALVPWYNRGIVISKNKAFTSYTSDSKLFQLVSIINKYKNSFAYFNYAMQQEFSYELMTDSNLSVNTNSPFIFNLVDKQFRLSKINDEIFIPDNAQIAGTPATFRAFNAFIYREKFEKLLKYTHYLLS